MKIIEYEKSHHIPEIALSVAVFIVFELLSMFAQGKLPFYDINHCSPWFFVGILLLLGVTLGYLKLLFVQMNKVLAKYRQYNIEQEIYLDGKS